MVRIKMGIGRLVLLIVTGVLLTAGVTKAAYTRNSNGTVTDTATGLVWQQTDDNQKRTWEGAISYCQGLDLAGFTDWRLPDAMELGSITNRTRRLPTIDTTAFSGTKSFQYWSSTSHMVGDVGPSNLHWAVDFGEGGVDTAYKDNTDYVRCVRSGPGAWPLEGLVGIQGTILDGGGNPFPGVKVTTATGVWTNSDSQGHYALTLAPGSYLLTFTKASFSSVSKQAAVMVGQSKTLNVAFNIPVVAPASLTVPAYDADGNYSVRWGASATVGATYVLEEATNSNFTVGKRTVYSGTALIAAIRGRLIGVNYYYRVRAVKAGGYMDSPWNNGTNGCTVKFPTAGGPASLTVPTYDADGNYSVRWGASATVGATYVLEEATNSNFTIGKRTAYSGTALIAAIRGRLIGVNYYYRVRAVKVSYIGSSWLTGGNGCQVPGTVLSSVSTISVPPTDADGSYSVNWGDTATPGVSYAVEEATNSAFTLAKRTVYTGTAKTIAIGGRLAGITYYYRVKRIMTGYRDSAWQAGANGCVVNFAGVPGPITVPATDADGSYPVTWTASGTAGVTYVLEESTDSAFSARRTAYSGPGCSTMISGRALGLTYYYRVKAFKAGLPGSAWRNGLRGCFIGTQPPQHLPGTGQIQSYTDTFGEDPDYTLNPPLYWDNGDGTVTDENTGLVWQQQDDGVTRSASVDIFLGDNSEADTYCRNLSLAGGGWRLPSKKELVGIVDYGRYSPAIDPVFTGTKASPYWSSTRSIGNFDEFETDCDPPSPGCIYWHEFYYAMWYVDFSSGTVSDSIWDEYYVRCVRDGQ